MNPQFREPVFFVPDSKTVIDTAVLRDGILVSTIEAETLEQIRLRYPGAEVGEFDDVIAGKADSYKSEPVEITPAAFDEALCVLPPVGWGGARGVESFKMSERTYGVITAIYARVGKRCFHFSDSILMSADAIAERIGESVAFKATHEEVNASYCQNCVWATHPEMLTTYCLRDGARCDRCGNASSIGLAMVKAIRCAIDTLCPDDVIRRCIRTVGHAKFCDGGVR
jgi:hypothetical protein